MQAFSRFFVDRWQFTLILFGMLLSLGAGAYFSIPKSEDPIVQFPAVTVAVVLPGADAEQMERLVAIPLEQALNRIEDVDQISSSSSAGLSTVQVQFIYGVDPERKYDETVRELNVVRPDLPDGITLVRADRANPAQTSVVQLALVSDTASYRKMEAYARELRDELERAGDVQQAYVWGVPPSEVHVTADLEKLAAYQLPMSAVADALKREGADVPVGSIETGGKRLNVEATGPFNTLDEIRGVTLRAANGVVLTVGDVAEVSWASGEHLHIARYNGKRALFVSARAKLGSNIFSVVDNINRRLEAFTPRLPSDIKLERGFNQAETVRERLDHLGRDFAIAIGLVLLTVLPLGFRPSLVVMIAVPLSFAIGMLCLQLLGYSLNQLSIAGFVLALGLLVDDSIVVTENISRHLREGMTRREAAIAGVSEINVAVLGCTATLLLAFLPLLNLPESSGDFIRSLPMAVVFTVAGSLFVSLTIVPFMASRILPKKAGHNVLLDVVMGGIHAIYRPVLRVALAAPRLTVLIGLLLFGASLTLVPKLGFSLFPENDSPYFMIDVELPAGASIDQTDAAVRHADQVLASEPRIQWRFANSGRDNPQVYYNVFSGDQKSNIGQIYARFDHWNSAQDRPLMEAMRKKLEAFPGARFNVRRFENGPPIEAPIAVRLRGADIEVLGQLAAKIEDRLVATPGTRNVVNPLSERLIDLDLNVDPDAAALAGVAAGAVDQELRISVGGAPVANFRDPVGDAYPVVLRGTKESRVGIEDVERLQVWSQSGVAVPLSALAKPTLSAGPAQINRFQRERTVTVTAYTQPGFLTGDVTASVAKAIESVPLPPGYTLSFGGQAEAQSRSFSGLGPAIMIAVFGVLAVLLLEFGSFASAAIVAFVIPMGVMGGLLALYLGHESLSFTAIIGFIALTGIEIKNSILLVEFANQERARGTPLREAIEKAGELRFLPVLLTSLTAIGGLIPLVLDRSPLYSPLAMVIIGGLVSSTLIARIVTPPLYLLLAPKSRKTGEGIARPAPAPAE